MTELLIKLSLPDALRQEAEAHNLLQPEAIENPLREELRRRCVSDLFAAADQLADVELPAMTAAEVEAEIQTVRRRHCVLQAT